MKKVQGRRKREIFPVNEQHSTDKLPLGAVENAFASYYDYGGVGEWSLNRLGDSRKLDTVKRFPNLHNGITPWEDHGDHGVSVSEAIFLCQKAYWNVPIFKNTIDIMAEFSNSDIHWEGGNRASREFFQALWKKVGMWNLKDQWFREYYRSGNVALYRFDGKMSKEDARKLASLYPEETSEAAARIPLPVRYIMLNPVDIRVVANVSFFLGCQYYKVLSPYELSRLRNPVTEEEKQLFDTFTPQQKWDVQHGIGPLIMVDPQRLHMTFYKKQDYEPLAIPMGYCVLDDIDMKLELKKMDRVILRTVESTILLITMGDEPEKGGVNQKAIEAMQDIFRSETVGRVLVADYTTKVDFKIPDLKQVLGPEKYEIINEDIQNGLNNIFWGEQKFANAMIKIKVFVERLRDGRQAFIEHFLVPEVRRIAKLMGFKSYPMPVFKEIDLQDEVQVAKMFTRLAEIGVLTADETLTAIKSGILPTADESQVDQLEYFENRQRGMYQPLIGPVPQTFDQIQQQQEDQQDHDMQMKMLKPPGAAGRPSGTKAPQSTKKVKPIGTKASHFDAEALKDIVLESDSVVKAVERAAKKQHKLKKLNEQQKEAAFSRALSIFENESRENWMAKVNDYVAGEQPINHEACAAIEEIAYEHQLSRYSAALLYHSRLNG